MNFLGACVWGDLSLIGYGSSNAIGEGNLGMDFLAGFLGIMVHDTFLFYLGGKERSRILSYSFFKKKLESGDANTFYENYMEASPEGSIPIKEKEKKSISERLPWIVLLSAKFNVNSYTSLPIHFGKNNFKFSKFIKNYIVIDFAYSLFLFSLSYLLLFLIPYRGIYLNIPNLSAAILSIVVYILYSTFLRILKKLFRIPGYGKSE